MVALALAGSGCGAANATTRLADNAPGSTGQAATSPAAVARGSPAPEALFVLAASDLQFALPDLAAAYEAETGRKLTISFGSSGNFAAQIENGAPADLFFAADRGFIERLDRQGLLREGSRRVYATGRLVIAPAKSAAVEPKSLEDLGRPELKKIAIANPEHAPYGRAAKQALQAKGLWNQVESKLVLGENIAQTFQLVRSGNADAGLVALSVVLGVPGAAYTLVDASLHDPLTQEAAVLESSKQPEAARDFLAFVTGPSAQPVMKRYGFLLPGEE